MFEELGKMLAEWKKEEIKEDGRICRSNGICKNQINDKVEILESKTEGINRYDLDNMVLLELGEKEFYYRFRAIPKDFGEDIILGYQSLINFLE